MEVTCGNESVDGGDGIVEKRKIITAILAALLVGASAQADLMPARGLETGILHLRPASPGREQTYGQVTIRLAGLEVADRNSLPWERWNAESTPSEPVGEPSHLYVLADRRDSASLCLCALLGLGLCKAAPCVKRFSWGAFPSWYYEGGPYQIGHSLVISPECDDLAPVCFTEPPCRGRDFPRRCSPEVVGAL